MDPQEVATATLELIKVASVPATLENAKMIVSIHQMLGGIASGELIISVKPEPAKSAKE